MYPARCKICLTKVSVWVLAEHSKNCFAISSKKQNLDKLNQKILRLAEDLKNAAKEKSLLKKSVSPPPEAPPNIEEENINNS